ncbi:MAG: helix-turn-helix domain-containing protein [Alphaproteobacteria bacterium]|nr:helix-turn-helix domain-containing protein [Alphaproteobacteria bacterium]
MPAKKKQDDYFSDSLERGLRILQAFDRVTPRLRASSLATKVGIPRSAARRFLLTLRDLGYVGVDGDYFFLLPRVLDLGHGYLASNNIDLMIQPLLHALAQETQESASLAVLDRSEVLVVARATYRYIDLEVGPGTRMPAYATALGQVLLAALPPEKLASYLAGARLAAHTDRTIRSGTALRTRLTKVARQGVAIVRGELVGDLHAIAIPVRDAGGTVVAALNVSTHGNRLRRPLDLAGTLELLQRTRMQIEAGLRAMSHISLGSPFQVAARTGTGR